MNRRTLLGRFVLGAAAVMGCGLMAPKAEATEIDSAPIFGPDMQWTGYVIRADYESGLGTWSDVSPVTGFNVAPKTYTRYPNQIVSDEDLAQAEADDYARGRAIAEARIESRLAEGLPIKRGALTFEDMQADCAALGCRLELHAPDDGWQLLSHYPGGVHTQANLEYRGGLDMVYERVDRWRTSLHEAAVRQKDLGTQIAESRRLRGARPLFSTD